jgi:hypothetical protein
MTAKIEPRLGILAGAKNVQKNTGNYHQRKIKTSPLLQLSSPNLYICSTVALGKTLIETKLL